MYSSHFVFVVMLQNSEPYLFFSIVFPLLAGSLLSRSLSFSDKLFFTSYVLLLIPSYFVLCISIASPRYRVSHLPSREITIKNRKLPVPNETEHDGVECVAEGR